MTYKLVIFDMGNTLLDFHSGMHTDEEKDVMGTAFMSKYLMDKHKISISSDTIKSELIDKWYADFYKREELVELDINKYITVFLGGIGFASLDINSKAFMTAFYKAYIDEVVVNIGALEALAKLDGKIKIGVISNCILFDQIYEEIFEQKGLAAHINKFIFSYSRQIRKPDKRLFDEMMVYFNVVAEEVVMIGDSYKSDLKPAKELGMKTILYCKEKGYNANVDFVITNLIEAPGIINKLNR